MQTRSCCSKQQQQQQQQCISKTPIAVHVHRVMPAHAYREDAFNRRGHACMLCVGVHACIVKACMQSPVRVSCGFYACMRVYTSTHACMNLQLLLGCTGREVPECVPRPLSSILWGTHACTHACMHVYKAAVAHTPHCGVYALGACTGECMRHYLSAREKPRGKRRTLFKLIKLQTPFNRKRDTKLI